MPGDINPAALPGAVASGATPGSTQETVSFVLTEQHLSALEFAVTHGITQYDSVGQFAETYGQSPKVIFELQKYLARVRRDPRRRRGGDGHRRSSTCRSTAAVQRAATARRFPPRPFTGRRSRPRCRQSGYLLYSPSFAQGGTPLLEGGWGGTSFVGPQLNGVTAYFESSVGHRIGFWNPAIYGFAQGGKSPFNPCRRRGRRTTTS